MTPTRDQVNSIEISIVGIERDILYLRETLEKITSSLDTRCSLLRQQCETKYVHQTVVWKIGVILAGAVLLGTEGIKQIMPLIKDLLL